MPKVLFDLERGHNLSEVLGAVDIIRVCRVSELTAAPEGQLLEAVRYPGVPKLGAGYPGEPQWFVVNVYAEPDGPAAAKVTLTYSNKQGPTWNQSPPAGNDGVDVKQVTSSVTPKRRATDAGGAPMTLTPPPAYTGWNDYQSEADVLRPVGALVFERTETSHPGARLRDLTGKVNSLALGSYGVRTLLFARLDAQSDDGGRTWRVVYEFRYDPDQWLHADRYHAPDGKVPDGAAETTWDVYAAADFSSLGLDFTDSQTPI